jgi:hypothetical protein
VRALSRASAELFAPSLPKMFLKWCFSVDVEIRRSRAISRFVWPEARSLRTSSSDVPCVALAERDGLGYPIPLHTLGLAHTNRVADGGKSLVGGAAALLIVQRTILGGAAVC